MHQDSELLRQYADARSQDAFAELVNRHLGLVYSAALRRLGGDSHKAADVAQEVFTRLARDARRLSAHTVLTAWLYTTTRNVAVDLVRSEKRRVMRQQEAQAMAEADSGDPLPDWERIRPQLDSMMDRLDRRDREVILMRYFAAQPFREIGAALRISEDAARMRVDRALEKLRVLLATRGIRSSGTAIGILLGNEAAAAVPAGLAGNIVASAAVVTAAPTSWLAKLISMTTTQKAAAGVAFAALLATGTGIRETYVAHAALAAAEEGRSSAQLEVRRLEDLERELSQVRSEIATPTSPTASPQPEAGVAATGRGPAGTEEVVDQLTQTAREFENTKARLFFTSEWRRISARAIPFLEKAGASQSQMQAYMAMAGLELQAERFADGNWTVDGYQAVLNAEWKQKTRELLGDPVYASLDRMLRAEQPITQLANYTARLDMPLDQQQVGRLFEILVNDEGVRRSGGGLDWDQVYARADGILTTPQLSAWRRWNNIGEFRRQLIERMRTHPRQTASENPTP